MDRDFEIGLTLKDQVIPRAVEWFTGEATLPGGFGDMGEYDEFDEDFEEFEEEPQAAGGRGGKAPPPPPPPPPPPSRSKGMPGKAPR